MTFNHAWLNPKQMTPIPVDAKTTAILIEEIKRLREGLDKLSRLGNEPLYGNSIGNEIAYRVLYPSVPSIEEPDRKLSVTHDEYGTPMEVVK